eukprot:TRINITY_DN265_c0_g1_i1.p1 TRINITY_DN265_c0_g1~~TRINITY_DN265_c0_g1_i1.p1  ORF type:complete len:954 (-),score=141.23 TRINITY_DN265_c0_g1_i1:5399-8260(-)
MNDKIIKLFEVNTDAIATNRGFYYQYLLVLKKWITNFIDEKDIVTHTEVEDDIKEVGDEIIFTQVKCYSSSFSLNSKEIKKSVFNFFILYLKYKSLDEKVSFCFSTNSQISKREKLLFEWTQNADLRDNQLLDLCIKKIKEILVKEIKERRIKLLQKGLPIVEKEAINRISNNFKKSLEKNRLQPFVKSIIWEFNKLPPEEGVELLTKEIHTLLGHIKFNGKPSSLLFKVLISEIYRSSQKTKYSDRELKNETLLNIIKQTDDELSQLVNSGLTRLFKIEIESLKLNVKALRETQKVHSNEIDFLKREVQKPSNHIPKYLNLPPDFSSLEVLGWDDFLNEVNSTLSKKKVLSIYSEGGMGKTSFGKKFLKTFQKYDHIIWLNTESSISSSLLLDNVLKDNLKLTYPTKIIDFKDSYESLIGELNKIKGENLIIIDIQNSRNELAEINSLKLTSNWQKLILTRSHLKTITSTKLPALNFQDAKQIYLNFCNKESIEDKVFIALFEAIDYNVLVIELIAKTIQNSFDLSLYSIITAIKEQELDKADLEIDIDINGTSHSIKLFNYLIEKFSFPILEKKEINYLEFLSILPSNNIIIEDIILINGLSHYDENKTYITNIVNSLDKKGLITISNDRKRIDIHKIVREVIIYNQRKQLSPFVSNILFITWLTARIEEGYNAPKNSFRYLKYAESILDSIKEEYRSSLYQPLILLENEFLYAQRFYLGAKSNLTRLIDLAKRAENFSALNKNSLGVIYNNLALCYSENNKNSLAIDYFKKALNQYAKDDRATLNMIITTLNNLSSIYLLEEDLISAINNFKRVQKIRKENTLYDDQQLSFEYRILSQSYAITGSFEQAIKLLESGIELHKSLNPSNRNDFYLANYYNELSNLYVVSGNANKAIENQEIAIQILENMGLNNSSYLLTMYEISKMLYQYLEKTKKENEMKEKIELFKAHQS